MELSDWFRETSLRDGTAFVFGGQDLSMVAVVLLAERLFVLTGTGGRTRVDALPKLLCRMAGVKEGLISSVGVGVH